MGKQVALCITTAAGYERQTSRSVFNLTAVNLRPNPLCYPGRRPVSDQVSDNFARICDQLATLLGSKAGRRQVRAVSTCRDSSNLVADRFAACFRPAFDRPATRTRHACTRRSASRSATMRLDSVMEFGL